MNKERLLKLADFLDKVSPKRFKLDCWAERGFRKNKCNTTACACGWATILFKEKLSLKDIPCSSKSMLVYSDDSGNLLYGYSGVKAFFDIEFVDCYYLFSDDHYSRFNKGPKHVAKRIRKFVKNEGKIL